MGLIGLLREARIEITTLEVGVKDIVGIVPGPEQLCAPSSGSHHRR